MRLSFAALRSTSRASFRSHVAFTLRDTRMNADPSNGRMQERSIVVCDFDQRSRRVVIFSDLRPL